MKTETEKTYSMTAKQFKVWEQLGEKYDHVTNEADINLVDGCVAIEAWNWNHRPDGDGETTTDKKDYALIIIKANGGII